MSALRNSYFRISLFAALLLASSSRLHGQDSGREPVKSISDVVGAARVRDVIETVMEHHVDPPTRQQMILEVLRGVAESASARLPSGLSTRLSAISDVDAIYRFMDEERQKLSPNAESDFPINRFVMTRLNPLVPGGVDIVPDKEYAVNEQLAANRYVGIGVQAMLDRETQRLKFNGVIPGGTAGAAGIVAGDIVESVDGKDTFQVPINDVIQWLRGPEDTIVKLSVRSPDKETREVEIVRRVVPFKRLNLIEQTQNAAVALIRIDRVGSSTVHELRKLILELPESVTLIILDLRFTTDGSLHHLHLLADALLEDGRLGHLVSRSGARLLTTEAGTVLEGRNAAAVYTPGQSEQIDWLAAVLAERDFAVFRDEYRLGVNEAFELPRETVREFVPLHGGDYYIGIKTAELLTANAEQVNREKPAGHIIEPDVAKQSGPKEWLMKLAGLNDSSKLLSTPMAVMFNQDGTPLVQPLPPGFRLPQPPVTIEAMVEQITAFLKIQ
jgi:hypothetical protein